MRIRKKDNIRPMNTLKNQIDCAHCKKPIFGHYLMVDEKPYHRGCFICSRCTKPIDGRYYEENGTYICRQCFVKSYAPECEGCRKPITGNYLSASGRFWHHECFKCRHCRKPIAEQGYYRKTGSIYCTSCYEQLFVPQCCICKKPVHGRYITDFWDNTYCAVHEDELHRCFCCGRLICREISNDSMIYNDGRLVCGICFETAVFSRKKAEGIFENVIRTLSKYGIRTMTVPLKFLAYDQNKKDAPNSMRHWGYAAKIVTLSQKQKYEIKHISVLKGLPAAYFAPVLAHEYGHAWLWLNNYGKLPPMVEEGLCELFAYLWVKEEKSRPTAGMNVRELEYWVACMEKNDDPYYGGGFKKALNALNFMSVIELMDYVKYKKNLPEQ